ncbi:MAG: RloB family protein [Chloroflexi bacterium]|nr:RloB family protein [Chloroflexota bacterium]
MMISNHVPEQDERPSGLRRRKPTFVIATEGEKTEPDYFAHLDRVYHEINIILLPANDGHSQPRQVLDKLLRKKQELARKELNSYRYWIVIDHDRRARPDLERVLKDAEANQISVADSNPCFEAWLVQHFSTLTDIVELSHVSQVKSCAYVIDKHLRRPDFDPEYRKGRLDSAIYMPKVNSAIQNAEFDEFAASHLDDFCYTGSRVQKLVQEILPGN